MEEININLSARGKSTHAYLGSVREQGYVPGVLYGNNDLNQNIQIDKREFLKQLKKHGKSGLFQVTIDNNTVPVKINEVQRDILSGEVIHVDLQRIDMKKKVYMGIPIHLFGDAIGVKSGGTIQQQIREIEVKALPSVIPESIHVSVSDINIGQAIYVKDLLIPEDVEVLHDPDSVILTILPPKMAEEVTANTETPKSEPAIVNPRDGHGIDAAK